ncbi:tetratricopeptide repeat protein [Hyunsoonleella flava]|uniref:histidine kinase n=2 Tax=Pseudomonadati TaxID=3379134 RepID=A0A4Q9FAV1_9FLAO|nr:tetratricopeptide repeat protein [Hyunsoonleella flava]TBN00425.1 tetratricopeptide repeat protein [Hyunsoonleella flava]
MKHLIYIGVILFRLCCFSQNKELDSLKQILKTTDSLKLKATVHGRIAWLNLGKNLEVSQSHLDSSFAILSKANNPKGMAQLNYRYAVLFRLKGDYDIALDYVDKSYQYNVSQKDSFRIANDLFQKGVINSLKGNYETSITLYYQILEIYEKSNNIKGIGMTLNSIGILQKNLEQYKNAISTYRKAITTLKGSQYKDDLANAYGNLGTAFLHSKQQDSALFYFKEAREMDKQLNYDWGLSINSQNIAELYIEKQDYKTAITYLKEAYTIQKKNNYSTVLAETRNSLGKAYLKIGELSKSEQVLQEGIAQAPESKKVLRELHYSLFQIYKQKRNYNDALVNYEAFSAYNDSILSKENLEHLNEVETKYNTEKKDKEIIAQKLSIQKQESQLQKKQSQYKLMTGLAIFLLLTSILIWFLYQQRQKRKNQEILTLKREQQVKTLELLMEGEEKERFRIAKELHDGVNVDLSAIKYKLTSLLEKNNEVINEAVIMIDKSCEQVRAISHNLVPPALKDFSLVEALEDYCSTTNAIHDAKVSFQSIGSDINLSKKAEANIFRIVQELVSNSIKHAEASEIDVQISYQNDAIQLTVEDNGKGFDIHTEKANGIGLQNVKSRIAYLNAKLDITSDDKGTSFVIDINTNKLS